MEVPAELWHVYTTCIYFLSLFLDVDGDGLDNDCDGAKDEETCGNDIGKPLLVLIGQLFQPCSFDHKS